MKLLDLYLLRRFVIILLFALVAFVLIVVVVELIGEIGNFLDRDVPFAVMVKYYLFYIPFLLVLALPIAMLLASLFSIGQMARYNELTAIKSVGISLYRVLAPLLILGLLMSLFAFFFGETVVPKTNRLKTAIHEQYLDPSSTRIASKVTNIFMRDQLNRLIFIGHYNSKEKVCHKVSILKKSDTRFRERHDAQTMQWQDSTWVLLNGYRRTFSEQGVEHAVAFDSLREGSIDFSPEQLAESQTAPEDMSYRELKRFTQEVIRNGGDPASWRVDLNLKISVPFANLVMVLFGASLASNKKRSGVIVGIIISLIICFLYYGFVKFFQTLGYNSVLAPVVSAWLANLIFLVLGIALLIATRK